MVLLKKLKRDINSCQFKNSYFTALSIASFKSHSLLVGGLVKSKYELFFLLEQRGTALRVYTVTDKVADVKAELKKEL